MVCNIPANGGQLHVLFLSLTQFDLRIPRTTSLTDEGSAKTSIMYSGGRLCSIVEDLLSHVFATSCLFGAVFWLVFFLMRYGGVSKTLDVHASSVDRVAIGGSAIFQPHGDSWTSLLIAMA